jgi:hypothetical protein
MKSLLRFKQDSSGQYKDRYYNANFVRDQTDLVAEMITGKTATMSAMAVTADEGEEGFNDNFYHSSQICANKKYSNWGT